MIPKQISMAFFSLCTLLLLASMTIAITPGFDMTEFTFVQMALPGMYIDTCYTYTAGGLVETIRFESQEKFIKSTVMINNDITISCLHKNETTETFVPVEIFK